MERGRYGEEGEILVYFVPPPSATSVGVGAGVCGLS